ncbi:P1 family peptidase [bacterium]|nr:P1 family peptidase [bacterium]
MKITAFISIILLVLVHLTSNADEPPHIRIRDLGIRPGIFSPGPLNAITDVNGVRVGHQTLWKGDSIRTGVTAVIPHGGDLFNQKTPAAVYTANGFGKAAGFLQVQELGNIETPIVLTNTLSVGRAVEAVVKWTLNQSGHENIRSVNAIVGETNDGYLNDIRGMHITTEDVISAIESAASGPVQEGAVGAGTGTSAFAWKGGIGTSSRHLPDSLGGYTVGVLLQSNFGGVLTIDGIPVGEILKQFDFNKEIQSEKSHDGSCMILIATDAPVSSRNLQRIAKRAALGLARTGSYLSNGSGDFIIAFSTKNLTPADSSSLLQIQELPNDKMDPLFLATVEAVEEAVYNSLVAAKTVKGYQGNVREAIPVNRLKEIFQKAKL